MWWIIFFWWTIHECPVNLFCLERLMTGFMLVNLDVCYYVWLLFIRQMNKLNDTSLTAVVFLCQSTFFFFFFSFLADCEPWHLPSRVWLMMMTDTRNPSSFFWSARLNTSVCRTSSTINCQIYWPGNLPHTALSNSARPYHSTWNALYYSWIWESKQYLKLSNHLLSKLWNFGASLKNLIQ